jgi:predicted transcriptional regulator
MGGSNGTVPRHEWRREQLRYSVLELVFQRTGSNCELSVTGSEIGAALELPYEELYRVVHYLENRGFLNYRGAGPRVCITTKGIRYLEELSGRRRSIRG